MPSVLLLGWSQTEKTDIHDHVRSQVGISMLRGRTENEWNTPGEGYLEQSKSPGGLRIPIIHDSLTEGQTVQLQAPYIHLMAARLALSTQHPTHRSSIGRRRR